MVAPQTVPYELFQREREKRIAAEQFIAWEDQLFAHENLIPGVKLTMRAMKRQLPKEAADNLSHAPIWHIAKNTGIGKKTTGKNITFLHEHNILRREEKYNPQTQETEIQVQFHDPFNHPKKIDIPDRPKSGYHPPKPTCANCGDDLEIETAVLCPTCKRKHIVNTRPATEHDIHFTEKFNDIVRMDEQLERADNLSHGSTSEEPAEEITDNPITYRMGETFTPATLPNTPPQVAPDPEIERQAGELLMGIAAGSSHIEMNTDPEKGKYSTINHPLYHSDAYRHLRGIRTKGAVGRPLEGVTRGNCFDGDNIEEWQICKEAALILAAAGFKPILLPSPTQGKHKGGGLLWIIYDQNVDAYSAQQTMYHHAPQLKSIKDFWPGGGINIRLPGGKYRCPDFEVWINLYNEDGEELSRDGINLAAVLLDRQTPSEMITAYEKPAADPKPEIQRAPLGAGGVSGKDLAKEFIADFNAKSDWIDIANMAGGFVRGKFLAVWRGDRNPKSGVGVDPKTDRAKDFGRPNEPAMDKYDVYCKIMAHQSGQDWQMFKRRDLAERCAYRRKQQEQIAS